MKMLTICTLTCTHIQMILIRKKKTLEIKVFCIASILIQNLSSCRSLNRYLKFYIVVRS